MLTSPEFSQYGLRFYFYFQYFYFQYLRSLTLLVGILFVNLALFQLINIKIPIFQAIDLSF